MQNTLLYIDIYLQVGQKQNDVYFHLPFHFFNNESTFYFKARCFLFNFVHLKYPRNIG